MTITKRSWGILGVLVAILITTTTMAFHKNTGNPKFTYDATDYHLVSPSGKVWVLPKGTTITLPSAPDSTLTPRGVAPDSTINPSEFS